MEISEIRKQAIKESAEYVSAIKEIEERGTRKLSYQDGFVDGANFIQTWINPNKEKPNSTKKIIFKLRNNDRRFGVFLPKDQFDRENMFCDGSFHKLETVEGWMYVPD